MTEALAIHGGQPVRSKPFPAWPVFGEEEEAALLRTLRWSGKWGRLDGDEVAQFDRRFADYHQAKHAIACGEWGTVSLRVALLAAGIEAGDEVIVPLVTLPGHGHGGGRGQCHPHPRRKYPIAHLQPRPAGCRGGRPRPHQGDHSRAPRRAAGRYDGHHGDCPAATG